MFTRKAAHVVVAETVLALRKAERPLPVELTHSQYAVPLLDRLFADPVVASSDLVGAPGMPSKQMVMTLLRKLRDAGILKVMRESRGRRAQVLALAELINLCEGKEVL